MTMLRLSHVGKSLGGNAILNDISFDVERGEMVSLLGPSGCGKSTSLRCIAGFEDIDSGEITIAGRVLSTPGRSVAPEHRQLGIVFQNYAVWPHMTVGENVAFGLEVQHLSRAKITERVNEVLDLVGLPAMAQRYPAELSGGQQQRLAIARSLVVQPSVLLFDEPLSNLDARLRARMRGEIRALQQRIGITAIYVTHDKIEAMTMSDRVVIMNHGVIVETGTPRDLFERPRTEFAARFLGAANIWRGVVREGRFHPQGGQSIAIADAKDGPATAMLRPGAITLTGPGPDAWPATVTASTYLGEAFEIVCDCDGLEVQVSIPSWSVSIDPIPGTACHLNIPAAALRLIEADPTNTGEPS